MSQEQMNTPKAKIADPFEPQVSQLSSAAPEGEALYKLYQQTFKNEQDLTRLPSPDPVFAGKVILYKHSGNPRSALKVYFDGLGGTDVTHVDDENELLRKLRAGNVKAVIFAYSKEEKSSIATMSRVCGDVQTSYVPTMIISYLDEDHVELDKLVPQLLVDKHIPMTQSRTVFATAFKDMLAVAADPLKSSKTALIKLQQMRKSYIEGARSDQKKTELLALAGVENLAKHPNAIAILERIRVLLTVGEKDKAAQMIDEMNAKDATLGSLVLLKAQLERLQKGAEAGSAWLNQEIAKVKWGADSIFQLGQLFIKWRNIDGLLSIATKLASAKNFTASTEFLLFAAGYYRMVEDWNKFLETARVLVHQEPLNGLHLSILGEAYFRAGDHRQAEAFLLASRQQKGANEAEVIATLIKSSLKQKRMKFAHAMLADALKLFPDSPILKALQKGA